MKTKFALLLVFCAVSLNIFAQEKKIKDRRTNPELYYLREFGITYYPQMVN